MLSKIKVYGRLARFLGERSFEAEITTPLHAFKFLLANFPHLERHMMEQNYCIKVGKDEIDETELFNPIGQQEIKIVPVATGSRGFTRILAGAALIGLAAFTGGAGVGFSGLAFSANPIVPLASASFGTVALASPGNFCIFSNSASVNHGNCFFTSTKLKDLTSPT